jgi:hypothetical protein
MFDITKEEMMKNEAEHKAREMFANMLAEAILTSDSAPETTKLRTMAVMKAKKINNCVHDEIVEKYCNPTVNANAETLKKVVEYLELVELGIRQFVECTPLVEDTEEK